MITEVNVIFHTGVQSQVVPYGEGGLNTGHGETVKTVSAMDSLARQVMSVAPHGMTSSRGAMAQRGWAKKLY
jgi:hypothetical protein